MIISASRRTDIPAFYSAWFLNRVRAGWCAVPNPMNPAQVARVSLAPPEVDAIVFWSKNPAPLLPHLDELDARGFRYYFQFTLNAYAPEIEPHVPALDKRLETFRALSRRIGPERVIWRYDPIVISNRTDGVFHRERFAAIAESLGGATERVVVSVVDFYRKTDRRLALLEHQGYRFDRNAAASADTAALLADLAAVARAHHMEIQSCAEDGDLSRSGIAPGRCIDERLINRLWHLNLPYRKDPSQRKLCLCTVSKDIGVGDTCRHGCRYCYATKDHALAEQRSEAHDPVAPMLWGKDLGR